VDRLKNIISKSFDLEKETLHAFECGEGVILKSRDAVFKCLTLFNEQNEMIRRTLDSDMNISPNLLSLHGSFIDRDLHILHNFLRLKSLSGAMKRRKPARIVDFDVFMVEEYIVLKMPYLETTDYKGGLEDEMVYLLRDFKELGWISTDLTPKNIKVLQSDSQRIIFIDIGYFFVPYFEELFETTCRRAYVCLNFATDPKVKDLLRSVNQDTEFRGLQNPEEHQKSFTKFFKKAGGED
jgi:hypothetical protein